MNRGPAAKRGNPFLGTWRITEMEVWDSDYIDDVVPGFIRFEDRQSGEFQFGTVSGGIDYRLTERVGRDIIEFSWDGQNDNDPGCGRGWALLEVNKMEGRLYIHGGDDSWFIATRAEGIKLRRRSARRRSAHRRS